jgi:ABC-type lipoprotein export system ATPase subunit
VKVYNRGVTAVRTLEALSADFAADEFTAIMGCPARGSRHRRIAWQAVT